jgi:hypothetical protein
LSVARLPSLFLILMGSMDCLTTVIGVLYFGTVELNPLIASLVNSNIGAFVVLKLSVTFVAAAVLIFAERTLARLPDHASKSFLNAQRVLKLSYIGIVLFLVVVVTNNIIVIMTTM